MSLAAFALRICTVYALRGRTFAGARVEDSPQNPLPDNLSGVAIAVFSGQSSVKPDGRDLIGGDAETELAIHIHLPDKVALFTGAAPLTVDVRAGGTGPVFDIMWRQIVRVLLGDAPWAALWREFATKLGEVNVSPFIIETAKGARIQAREIRIPVMPIYDPIFGAVAPGTPWSRLLDLMEAEPETTALAAALRYEIESPSSLPDWNLARVALGLTDGELNAIGLSPIQPAPADPGTPNLPVTTWTVEDDGPGGETWTIDASTPEPGPLP